jgi:5-(carboxyamino)imidazole ribonucleotide mutase
MMNSVRQPQVAIVMGSDSDWPVMKGASETLKEFGIAHVVRVISAHRTPDAAIQFSRSAAAEGLQVLIAAAGGAAHLAGVLAACTPLPVIGVPIQSPALQGLDSLLSIVQMPSGVPVATVAINGAKNAALLAVQMLAIADPALHNKMVEYKESMRAAVEAKDAKLNADTNLIV